MNFQVSGVGMKTQNSVRGPVEIEQTSEEKELP
jgi:hypothetical protein